MSGFDAEAVRAFEHARWEAAAPAYLQSFALATRQFIDGLLDAAAVAPGQPVLDVACGPGHVVARALARGAPATGLDFSPAMLAVARAACPGLALRQGDAEALPFDDACFDAVVSNFGLHHVPRPGLALREARRVLRPGGRIAFTTWATPAENVAWRLVLDAVRRHGDPAASAAPPPGGGFGTPQHCLDALAQAGFVRAETRLERRVWRHADAAALLAALRAGTARMAALLDAQSPAALAAILADVTTQAAAYREGGGLALPIVAVLARAEKA